MTEQEWLACTYPKRMLEFVQDRTSDRKLRLFAVACCRRILSILDCEQIEEAVILAELAADGAANSDRMRAVLTDVAEAANSFPPASKHYQGMNGVAMALWARPENPLLQMGIRCLANSAAWSADPAATVDVDDWSSPNDPEYCHVRDVESKDQTDLLRDILGNPFRSVKVDQSWLTWHDGTVPKIAQVIYDKRAFDRLPTLVDALEGAGCTDADILNHCRQPGEHVRGCWVMDLILGKQ